MPVQDCVSGGQPGKRWGSSGVCYTYTPGDPKSSGAASKKAYLAGYAIRKKGGKASELELIDMRDRLYGLGFTDDDLEKALGDVHSVHTSKPLKKATATVSISPPARNHDGEEAEDQQDYESTAAAPPGGGLLPTLRPKAEGDRPEREKEDLEQSPKLRKGKKAKARRPQPNDPDEYDDQATPSGTSQASEKLTDAQASFYELKDVKLEDAGTGRHASWVPVFPEGVFEHPEYGELDFSYEKLALYKDNFTKRVRKIDIAVDIDHKNEVAVGWLKELQCRKGVGLFGFVEWNSLGANLVNDKQYRYISPQFGEYTDEESGETFSNVLIALTITNFPFLKKMPAIALKELAELKAVHKRLHSGRVPISASLHNRAHAWLRSSGKTKSTGGTTSQQRLAEGVEILRSLKAAEKRYSLMKKDVNNKPDTGDDAMGKRADDDAAAKRASRKADDDLDDDTASELDDDDTASELDDDGDTADDDDASAKRAKRAKRAKKAKSADDDGDTADDDGDTAKKASAVDGGVNDDDLYDDEIMQRFEKTSKNDSQPDRNPGVRNAPRQDAGTGKTSEGGRGMTLREVQSQLAETRRELAEYRLTVRKGEIREQIRRLLSDEAAFPKTVIDEFKAIALSDKAAGDRVFKILRQVQAKGLISLKEEGRASDPDDDEHDIVSSRSTSKKVKLTTDKKTGMGVYGGDVERQAKQYASEKGLDWRKLSDREKAYMAIAEDGEDLDSDSTGYGRR